MAMDNSHQVMDIPNLVQLGGRDPVMIVKGIQKTGGHGFMNTPDLGTDRQQHACWGALEDTLSTWTTGRQEASGPQVTPGAGEQTLVPVT